MFNRRLTVLWLCLALAGCSTGGDRRPQVTIVSGPGFAGAQPEPTASPEPAVPVVVSPPRTILPALAPVTAPPLAPPATVQQNALPIVVQAPAPIPTPQPPPPAALTITPPPGTAQLPFTNVPPPIAKAVPMTTIPEAEKTPHSPPQVAAIHKPAGAAPAAAKTPAAHTAHPADAWVSLEHWSRSAGLTQPHRVPGEATPTYSLAASNGTLTIHMGNQSVHWNGLDCHLGFAPQMVDGQPCIHILDGQKNLEPLLHNPSALAKANPVIVIDPGHGGTDVGSKSAADGHFEKEFTLDLARRLQALLANRGWTVLLTRDSDLNLSLSNRVAFAEEHKADLFLSLHFNSAAPDQTQFGLETYCLTPTGMPSTLTRGFRDNAALSFPNNGFDTQNLEYSVHFHRALLKVNGNADRGVRRARFLTVLQGQGRPAVLVEGGYLSNPKEARRIADPKYRQKLAEALSSALLENSTSAVSLAEPVPAASKLN